MSFQTNASPFGLGRSSEANDFATRAATNLLPWIREHYQIYTLNEANFTPAGLYNYHLRGDYYLGLTKDSALYDNMNLNSGVTPSRLAHIAETPRAFDATLDESINLVAPIGRTPEFLGAQEYGLLGASEPLAPVHPAHFFAREVASGSTLTEFLFAEQATMSYRLLPYMDNFHDGVRNFLVSEAMHFIDNIGLLRNRSGPNFNNTNNVHHAFSLEGLEAVGFFEIGTELDTLGLPGFTPAAVGLIDRIGGAPDVDFTLVPSFVTQFSALAGPNPTFVLPIYYALTAYREYTTLIRPDLQLDMQLALDGIFTNLFIEAVRTSYRLGGHYTLNGAGVADLNNTRFFTRRVYNGVVCSIQSDDFNFNTVRDGLRDFFNVYFNLVNSTFPVGTIVRLNTNPINGNTRNAYNHAQSNQTTVPALGNAAFQLHMDGGDLFRITGQNTPVRQRNRPNISRYQMESVDAAGIPRGVAVENVQEVYRTDAGEVPGIILYRPANQGTNNQAAHTPLNIVGRLLLSASYTVFNAGSYYTTRRDMRKLTKDDAPGHYPPLNEAMRSVPADPTRPFSQGRRAHLRGGEGILDIYAEQRADLIADYLAAMYDSLRGKYRDDFVNFYTGDFHTNELAYYTNAVSNYISNFTEPEDARRDEVLVGPRLTTRAPAGLEQASAGPGAEAALIHFRTADPELIYYRIDSPLLREVLRQLTTGFYTWYVTLAEQLDRGERNLLRAGLLEEDDSAQRALLVVGGRRGDPAQDRQRIRPSKVILEHMWPLLTARAKTAVESGEVPAHEMMRRLAAAVAAHRANTSQAIPAVPITSSFIDFGKLLRSPGQYALPPETSSTDVEAFLAYLQSTYYNDYGLIGFIAAEIEDARTELYTQDQLIAQFKKQFRSFRNEKALNRFTFPATATVVSVFRELIATDPAARAAAAITTTEVPPDPVETPAVSPPLAEPFRRP